MRLLIIDPPGSGLDLALRAKKDGHEVKLSIKQTEKTKWIGRGLVDVVETPHEWRRWADLIFLTDNTLYMRDIDGWRKEGARVVGATAETAEWELNRGVGQEVFRKHHIPVPPYKVFTDYGEAIRYVTRTELRYVSKPSGDADKALSYCSKSPADMVFMLERWKKLGKLKSPFILQEFIAGIEMAVGGWFGPGGFNEGWCENWEFKKLMNGEKGVATGEQGTVLRNVRTSKLARKVLAPLAGTLEKLGYCGYIDVNCIIDEKGTPWPLEFTMRPGWPTFNIQEALHEGDHVAWLMDLSKGKDARNFAVDTVAIGVVLSIPDYPYSHLTRKEVVGIPVYGVTPSLWNHIHPCEMMQAQDVPMDVEGKILRMPCLATAGDYVLVVSATGGTIRAAQKTVYQRLDKLSLPNSPMWRTDIGDRLQKQLPELQAKNYAAGLVF